MRIVALTACTLLTFGTAQATETEQFQHYTSTAMEFNCPIPPGFSAARGMNDLPTALKAAYADAAPLVKAWNDTDASFDKYDHGLEFVLHQGRRWVVGTVAASIAVSLHVSAYDLNDGKLEKIAFDSVWPPKDMCGDVENAAYAPHAHKDCIAARAG